MSAATDYPEGVVKQDPVTKAVAVRLPDLNIFRADWAVMTIDRGGGFAQHAEVESWTDLEPRS